MLAVGSMMRGDDAAGMLVGRELQRVSKRRRSRASVSVFLGEIAPENITGPIRRLRPTHVLIVDAAHMHREPGDIALIDPNQAHGNLTASTHSLPMGVLANYLRRSVGCKVIIVGIQAAERGYGVKPSRHVAQAARKLAAMIVAALQPKRNVAKRATRHRRGRKVRRRAAP